MNINDKRFMFGEIYKIKPTCTVGWRFIDNLLKTKEYCMKEKEMLLKLRSEVAKKSGQSTYLVPNDKEIEMLLKVRPKTIAELTALKGFPAKGKRVAAYGNALIDIFTKKVSKIEINGQGEDMKAHAGLESTSIFG